MIKKTMTYTDFNGTERTEDFYFNLTKAELTEMEMGTSGGFAEMIQNIIKQQDTPSIMKIFKDLLLKAYGVKSADGRGFFKNEKLREEFESTQAYSDLFMELALDAEKAAEFVNGIMPSDLSEEVKKSDDYAKIVNMSGIESAKNTENS